MNISDFGWYECVECHAVFAVIPSQDCGHCINCGSSVNLTSFPRDDQLRDLVGDEQTDLINEWYQESKELLSVSSLPDYHTHQHLVYQAKSQQLFKCASQLKNILKS